MERTFSTLFIGFQTCVLDPSRVRSYQFQLGLFTCLQVGIFDEPSQNSEAVQNAHDLEKVEPASDDGSRKRYSQGSRRPFLCEVDSIYRGESKKKRRHKSTSWRSLFKRFRRKLHNEKSARKRDRYLILCFFSVLFWFSWIPSVSRVYRFVTEIKKKLDDDRHSDRSRIRDRSAERRREESPRRSPSKDAETMKRRLSRSASPPSRASVSDSESRRGSEREAAATSSRKRSHSNWAECTLACDNVLVLLLTGGSSDVSCMSCVCN